jgi:hypothetical protein
MRILQRCLGVAFLLCVVGAIYLSLRAVPLPDLTRIDRAITEAEPVQGASDRPPFTTTIKGYTYTLTPRATYAIAGLVVSQHRGDALPSTTRRIPVISGTSASCGARTSRTGRTGR